jgi:tripartite ATP-independent transporter DctM subunit
MAMLIEYLPFFMFAAAFAALLRGYPVAFTLAGVALLFAIIGILTGEFDPIHFRAFPQRIYGNLMEMDRQILVAVPLFVFMGVMLEKSKVAEELLDAMGALFGTMRGGLGISVIVVGALLAASTGIVGATVVTMGLLSLPTMLKRGYSPSLAAGSIAAAGTLGQIIPPSIVLVLLGDQISNAYQEAQRAQGIFSPDIVSVGDLFAGALIPGLLLVSMYVIYQIIIAVLRPQDAPAAPPVEGGTDWGKVMHALLPPLGLIFAVLGSILAGLATPTEAAGVGAVGATFLAGARNAGAEKNPRAGQWMAFLGLAALIGLIALVVIANIGSERRLYVADLGASGSILAFALVAITLIGAALSLMRLKRTGVLDDVMSSTAAISAMVFVILIGASLFSLIFRELGGDDLVQSALAAVPGGKWGALAIVMLVMFLLGFFLDFIEITFVVVPIVAPILLMMGIDPVWLGVLMAMNLQTSFLTPPFGFALFYLRGVAPPEVTTAAIYRGALPFVVIQILAIIAVALIPALATGLPEWLYG